MKTYLQRLKDGEDATMLISEMTNKLEVQKNTLEDKKEKLFFAVQRIDQLENKDKKVGFSYGCPR